MKHSIRDLGFIFCSSASGRSVYTWTFWGNSSTVATWQLTLICRAWTRWGYMVEHTCFSADMPHGGCLRAPSAGSKPVLTADGNVAARIRTAANHGWWKGVLFHESEKWNRAVSAYPKDSPLHYEPLMASTHSCCYRGACVPSVFF